jgi:hypothetical protein
VVIARRGGRSAADDAARSRYDIDPRNVGGSGGRAASSMNERIEWRERK